MESSSNLCLNSSVITGLSSDKIDFIRALAPSNPISHAQHVGETGMETLLGIYNNVNLVGYCKFSDLLQDFGVPGPIPRGSARHFVQDAGVVAQNHGF